MIAAVMVSQSASQHPQRLTSGTLESMCCWGYKVEHALVPHDSLLWVQGGLDAEVTEGGGKSERGPAAATLHGTSPSAQASHSCELSALSATALLNFAISLMCRPGPRACAQLARKQAFF